MGGQALALQTLNWVSMSTLPSYPEPRVLDYCKAFPGFGYPLAKVLALGWAYGPSTLSVHRWVP